MRHGEIFLRDPPSLIVWLFGLTPRAIGDRPRGTGDWGPRKTWHGRRPRVNDT